MSKKCYKVSKENPLFKRSCWRVWKNKHILTVDQVKKKMRMIDRKRLDLI